MRTCAPKPLASWQVYEALPFDAAGLHTSLAVPPLLAAFYVVLGCLFIAGDALALPAGDAATTAAVRRCADGRVVAAAYGVLALDLQLSAALYSGGTGFGYISAVLAAATAATWAAFDGTKQGAALAAFTALAAPASELVLLRLVPLWRAEQAGWNGRIRVASEVGSVANGSTPTVAASVVDPHWRVAASAMDPH
eukprot:362182-Chlamydomonas_euryale.AAC.8